MTKPTIANVCDSCGKNIDGNQYFFDVFQGKTSFAQGTKTIVQGKGMDICHSCFMQNCKSGYEPKWVSKHKNPKYKKGSEVTDEKDYWIIEEVTT